jgi:hypothetical protein
MEFSFFLLIPPHVRGATHRKWVIALSKKLGNKETAVLLRQTKKEEDYNSGARRDDGEIKCQAARVLILNRAGATRSRVS